METVTDFILLGSKITGDGDCSHEIKRCLPLGRKAVANLDSILKTRDTTLPTKVCLVKAFVSPVVMYGCESWTTKKAEHQRTDAFKLVLEKTLESPLDSKEIKPVNPKGNQSWIFIGRTDAEAEVPILWPSDVKSWLIGNDSDARKYWRQEEKRTTEDKMVGWHYWFNGHEFEQTPGDGEGQGSLECCSPCGHKKSDMPEWFNNNNLGTVKQKKCIDRVRYEGWWVVQTFQALSLWYAILPAHHCGHQPRSSLKLIISEF